MKEFCVGDLLAKSPTGGCAYIGRIEDREDGRWYHLNWISTGMALGWYRDDEFVHADWPKDRLDLGEQVWWQLGVHEIKDFRWTCNKYFKGVGCTCTFWEYPSYLLEDGQWNCGCQMVHISGEMKASLKAQLERL